MTDRRIILTTALWVAVALALAALAWSRFAPAMQDTIASRLGKGDYQLETTEGAPFTEASLQGRATAVFFGFTHCPEVCPTTMGDLVTLQEELGPKGQDLDLVFVTVDPERDTREVLAQYLSWAPGVIGVTGTPEEIAKATAAFAVYSAKVPLEGEDYTMDHTALVLLFDRDGEFFEPIGYQEDFDRALAKLERLLAL